MTGMGLLQVLKRPEKKKSIGVCIPDAHKKSVQEEALEQSLMLQRTAVEEEIPLGLTENSFRVTGIFAVTNSIMLEGIMLNGSAKIGKEAKFNGQKIKILDITVAMKSAGKIQAGQKGALFVKSKGIPNIKTGDILEF